MNESIALFMELPSREEEWRKPYPTLTFIRDSICYPIHSIKYHSSWDWLMPVVEKIESMSNDVRIYTGHTTITANGYPVCQVVDVLKINATCQAVYQFIQWYNKQKEVKPEHNVIIGNPSGYCTVCGFPVDECNCINV